MKRVRHSLQTLRVFVLVARTGSVSAAALQAHLTQSAVTKHVQALEEMLGARLFERSGQGMLITTAARPYLRSVQRALQMLDDAEARMSASTATAQSVRLGVAPAVAQRWLIPLLDDFEARHPGVRVQLVARLPDAQGQAAQAYAEIRAGTGRFQGWRSRYLVGRHFCFAMASARREFLRARGIDVRRINRRLIEALPLLSHVLRPTLWDESLRALGLEGTHAERIDCEQYSVLIPAAVAGRGLAMVPPFLVQGELAGGQLVRIGAMVTARHGFYLLTPKAQPRHAGLEALTAWLGEQAAVADALRA
ncbi:LysR family transcriptional regulator [Xenophilus azovorans]|uniref:LysR family transcriptional regulator n=1 Tax=Xenophilus azovorans TaxID=151755 RepID=UPI000570C194|nr:LysR family transcriptional regulator [Xenophilus azovorans]